MVLQFYMHRISFVWPNQRFQSCTKAYSHQQSFMFEEKVCLPELRLHNLKILEAPPATSMSMTPTPATPDGSFGCASMKIHHTLYMLRHYILMYFVCYLSLKCRLSCQLCLKNRLGKYNYGKVYSRRQNGRK